MIRSDVCGLLAIILPPLPDEMAVFQHDIGTLLRGQVSDSDEKPVHRVELSGFWIGQTEVTNDQYASFLNDDEPGDVSELLDLDDEHCEIERTGGRYRAQSGRGTGTVERLLREGALSVDSRGPFGRTPIHVATYNGHEDIVRLLVENGADVDARDEAGSTLLHLAEERCRLGAAAMLLNIASHHYLPKRT